MPSPDQLAERVSAVLEVLHLIFTTGHTAPIGEHLVRPDLVDSAISLARMLHLLMPNEAAIAAVHAQAPTWQDTDWAEIVGLYDVLLHLWPSPVVELNRAVAVGLRDGPQAGLNELTPLLAEPALASYGYLSAARADFLSQLHQWTQAAEAYQEALTLTDNDVERAFLTERLDEVQRISTGQDQPRRAAE